MMEKKQKITIFILLGAVAILFLSVYLLLTGERNQNQERNEINPVRETQFKGELSNLIPDNGLIPKSFVRQDGFRSSGKSLSQLGIDINWKEMYSVSYKSEEESIGFPLLINLARYQREELQLIDALIDLFQNQEEGIIYEEIFVTPNTKIADQNGVIIQEIAISPIGERALLMRYISQEVKPTYYTALMFYKKDILVILLTQRDDYDYDLLIEMARKIDQKI